MVDDVLLRTVADLLGVPEWNLLAEGILIDGNGRHIQYSEMIQTPFGKCNYIVSHELQYKNQLLA